MHVVITGATGFIGRATVRAAAGAGHGVSALARRGPRTMPEGAAHVPFDLDQPSDPFAGIDAPDAVVHTAGLAHAIADPPEPQDYDRLNRAAAVRLARQAAAAGARRFVFLSTLGVHKLPDDPACAVDETAPLGPETRYAQSKASAETELAEVARATGMSVTCIRPTLVSGAGAPGNLARLASLVRLGLPLPVPRLANRRSFVDVDDLAAFLLRASDACEPGGEGRTRAVLVADPLPMSTATVMRELAVGMERVPRQFPVPGWLMRGAAAAMRRAGDYDKLFGSLEVDPARAVSEFGWQPQVGVRTSMRRTGAAYIARRSDSQGA